MCSTLALRDDFERFFVAGEFRALAVLREQRLRAGADRDFLGGRHRRQTLNLVAACEAVLNRLERLRLGLRAVRYGAELAGGSHAVTSTCSASASLARSVAVAMIELRRCSIRRRPAAHSSPSIAAKITSFSAAGVRSCRASAHASGLRRASSRAWRTYACTLSAPWVAIVSWHISATLRSSVDVLRRTRAAMLGRAPAARRMRSPAHHRPRRRRWAPGGA